MTEKRILQRGPKWPCISGIFKEGLYYNKVSDQGRFYVQNLINFPEIMRQNKSVPQIYALHT